jgi:DNA-binding beta-propeller fold protein YncE
MKLTKRRLRMGGVAAVLGFAAAMMSPLSGSALSFVVTVPVGVQPVATVISADDTTLFVANSGDGTITVLDVRNPAVPRATHLFDLDSLTGGVTQPGTLLLSHDGATLFVADPEANKVHALDVRDLSAPRLWWSKGVGEYPAGMALSADSLQLVVTNAGVASVNVITISLDRSTATVSGPYFLPGYLEHPSMQALSPVFGEDGQTAFVIADGVSSLWVFDMTDSLAHMGTPGEIYLQDSPYRIAFFPGTVTAYVSGAESVMTYDFETNDRSVLEVFRNPGVRWVAVSPDARTVAVTNMQEGSVNFSRIDGPPYSRWTETLGTGPTPGVVFSHNSRTAFAANSGSNTVSIIGLDGGRVEPTPSGALLATRDISLPVGPQFMDLPREDDAQEGDHWLNGRSLDCGLETGEHPYGTLSVTVTTAGTYTFRIVGTSPNSLDDADDYVSTPITDPFLAVYSEFDPLTPDAGVVGCDDDRGAVNDSRPRVNAETGVTYDENWSYFSTTLEPGSYTLVLTTYDTYDAVEWGEADPEARTWDPQVLTASFELWGPSGGLTVAGSGDVAALAKTGNGTTAGTLAGVVLALLGGATALAITRVRRPRSETR